MAGLTARVAATSTAQVAFERLAARTTVHQNHSFGGTCGHHCAASGVQNNLFERKHTLLRAIIVDAEQTILVGETLQPGAFIPQFGAKRFSQILQTDETVCVEEASVAHAVRGGYEDIGSHAHVQLPWRRLA